MTEDTTFDEKLDLVLERVVDVPRALVWKAWTEPEHLKQWFCPAPWSVARCEIDLRPGGLFHTVMQSPDGQEVDNPPGCYLEVIPGRRLVFTDALGPGFRPNAETFMTAIIEFEDHPGGTLYRAIAKHASPEGRQQHEDMGFYSGWGTALDQLVAHVKSGAVK